MITNVLRLGRGASKRLVQRATCKVERSEGWTTDADGYRVPAKVEVYRGQCYTRYPGVPHETPIDSVGTAIAQTRLLVFVPHGSTFAVDDIVTILHDPDAPHLAGMELRVASVDEQSHATAQRLLCEDNQKGVKVDG